MKEIITSEDIENMVADGVRQISNNETIFLTDLAREKANYLGVNITPHIETGAKIKLADPIENPTTQTNNKKVMVESIRTKPEGCLHNHIETQYNNKIIDMPNVSRDNFSGTINKSRLDRFVEAVTRLKKE